ncbi:MAG: aspartate aminotransferase family protein [Burkholderiaceae bacterium]
MKTSEFRQWLHRAADWTVDYRTGLREKPVRASSQPGDILARLPGQPPEDAEPFEQIFQDFEQVIEPGMTHWQHPRFFAYFPSNAAPPAVIAEQLAGAIAAQGMLWQTSPALTELEIGMVDWLRQAIGLPVAFKGSLQDTASSATLCAVLTMREKALQWQGNVQGLAGQQAVRIYASGQTHSSIDRAIWISGIGQQNLVRVSADESHPWPVDVDAMRAAIQADRQAGLLPAGIIGCVGGTSIGACDDLDALASLAQEEGLMLHIDAAWAGSAMICEEYRSLWRGIERADSIVFNPHKWLGTPMECSAHFVRDPSLLVKTLAIQPEYLKTQGKDGLVNFSEWSVTLGRRFRALKLWFLIRHYGLSGLRQMIRQHVTWAQALAKQIDAEPDFELTSSPVLSLFSFRYRPVDQALGEQALNALNERLLSAINDDGRTYLTQTRIGERYVIRFQVGPFETTEQDIQEAWQAVASIARSMPPG